MMEEEEAKSRLPSREQMLEEKARRWRQYNNKKFAEKKKHGFVEAQKEVLPA
jgi:hypothetical protein